jgi:hypothetical protein
MANDRAAKPKEHAEKERERIKQDEDEVTSQSDDSFPASDPPSFTPVKGPAGEKGKEKKRQHASVAV